MIWWGVFIAVLGIAIAILQVMDSNYTEKELEKREMLSNAWDVNEELGEKLVQCENGTYEVYKPWAQQTHVCGQSLYG